MDLNNFLVSGVVHEITEMAKLKNNLYIFKLRLRSLKNTRTYLYYDVSVVGRLATVMHSKLKVGMYVVVQGEFSAREKEDIFLLARKFMSWQSMISSVKSGIKNKKGNDTQDVVSVSTTTLLREVEHSNKRGTNF